ncbi:hypothetical protein AB0H83_14920 [Dactylosporangium sp. NPDC050688]|uniref:hypothetical protein n=1 Tax=Dactylosporangium sp. NPDC050688 TaxID=3157217 RepID=UPI0033E395D1
MARGTSGGPGWAAPPPKPMRYPPHHRLADAWHGWRDGRKGIPVIPAALLDLAGEYAEEQRQLVGTPRLEVLRRRSAELINVECERHDRRLIGAVGPAALATSIDSRQKAVDELRTQLAVHQTPPDDLALKERRSAEAERPDLLVRHRRLAEHARRLHAAASALAAAEQQRNEACERQVLAAQDLYHAERVLAARARRINEHHWRRAAAYWQHLVRSHELGPQLNAMLRPVGPELPSWAEEED